MMYMGAGAIIYVFLSAIRPGDGNVPDVPSMRVDLTEMMPGEVDFHVWENRPVLIYRREDADIIALRTRDSRLLDASSFNSEQPDQFVNNFRSESPEWFVAIALGTGQGCTVELLAGSDEPFQGQVWHGGFKDSCGDDRYDFAGRVFDEQYATRNLTVPDYSIEGPTLILGRQ